MSLKACIDQFSFFSGEVQFAAWAFVPDGTKSMCRWISLINGAAVQAIVIINCPSPDVAAHFGAAAANARFHGSARLEGIDAPLNAALRFRFSDDTEEIRSEVGQAEMHGAWPRFIQPLPEKAKERQRGRFLEIGSGTRSGISRRHHIPEKWDYKGSDVLSGPNVDIVADAHKLSSVIPARSIDAVMSISAFEHLAMPWKVAIELNRIMANGAIGCVQTHQMFPLHDQPWDFWRISADAWPALFNRVTGFRIIKAAMAEPGYMVSARWHPIVDFRG